MKRHRGPVLLGALATVVVALGTLTLLSAGSATVSLAVARMADERVLLHADRDVAAVGLTEDEQRELPRPGA